MDVSSASEWPRERSVAPQVPLSGEESWLPRGLRVLKLAEDATVPLLERVRFLVVFASGLDEFFSRRAAELTRHRATGPLARTAARSPPGQPLEHVQEVAGALMRRHAACFREAVLPALATAGIEIRRWGELHGAERHGLDRLFRDRVYPVMTPLLVDPAHPFPYISGLSLNLAVVVADPQAPRTMFARVKVSPLLPRLVELSPRRFVPLEDVIAAHLAQLFEGTQILEHYAFRVTRQHDLPAGKHITAGPAWAPGREPPGRWKGPVVRVEAENSISTRVLGRLRTELGVGEHAVYRLPGPLDLTALHAIADLNLPELKYPAAGDPRRSPASCNPHSAAGRSRPSGTVRRNRHPGPR